MLIDKKITIGIPVLNEEKNIPILIKRLQPVLNYISARGFDFEIIINENNSSDKSKDLLLEWAQIEWRVQVNELSRTITFQESILELMKKSKGDAFVLLQSDLQDPPELIKTFIDHWITGERIIAGVIAKRTEGVMKRSIRKIFYWILKTVSDERIVIGLQDFYLLDKSVVAELKMLSPVGLFLRGHISSRFGDIQRVPYLRADREYEKSKFKFSSKYSLALDGLLLFGTRFIRFISIANFIAFCMGVLGSIVLLFTYSIGIRPSMQGWASLGLLMLTLISLLGFTAALILEYLVRIYRFQIFSKTNNQISDFESKK